MMDEIRSLVDLLERGAERWGERVFAEAEDGSREVTFAGLLREAERVAGGLRGRFGARSGERVALLLPNCVEVLTAYFGILRAGAMAVPVNARLKAAEVAFILADAAPTALIVHAKTWGAAEEALAGMPELRARVVTVGFPAGEAPEGTAPLEALTGTRAPERAEAGAEDVAAIIYTSGTTGRPKGAMLTHGNVLFNVRATVAGHGLTGEDVHLLCVPLFHVTGLNTIMPTALAQGARLTVTAQVDPERLLRIIAARGCTTFFGVPTTFYLLTSLPPGARAATPTLRLICYSGAPMSALTIRALRAAYPGVELHNFFGLTETTSVSTVLPDSEAEARAESVGLPPPGVELGIVDEDGRLLASGETGELVIRAPSVMKGYYQRPEATAEALRGGWFHTGDAAYLDAEGYLYLQGRKKEMIIVAGENVYPIEVENALCAHPAVQEAAAFGVADRVFGETVAAAVVLRPGAEATERELRAFVAERLAGFKVPRSVRIVASLPRNASGKVVKRDITPA